MKLQVKIQKSPIPIVWLDTSIVANIAKIKLDKPCEKKTSSHIKELYELISKLINEGKIICPHASQSNEIWCMRQEWLDVMGELSLGIITKAPQSIYLKQKNRFVKAYLNDERIIDLSYEDVFYCDPIEEVSRILKNKYYVSCTGNIVGGDDKVKSVKNNIFEAWENIRKNNVKENISFDTQFKRELRGQLMALAELYQNYHSQEKQNDDELLNNAFGTIFLNQQINQWNRLGGSPAGIEGLVKFHESVYYESIPCTYLDASISAYLMTRSEPIKTGDCMDIEHISTMLPYSNIFITDKAMKDLILRRRIDKKYQTEVFSISDIDNIKASLLR